MDVLLAVSDANVFFMLLSLLLLLLLCLVNHIITRKDSVFQSKSVIKNKYEQVSVN